MATERPNDDNPEQPEPKAKPKAKSTEPNGDEPKAKTKPAAKPVAKSAGAASTGDKPKPKPNPAPNGDADTEAMKKPAREGASPEKPKAKTKPKETPDEESSGEDTEATPKKPAKDAVTADKPKGKAKESEETEDELPAKSDSVTADKPKGKKGKNSEEGSITDDPKGKKKGLFSLSFSSFATKREPVGVWGIDLGQCALKAIRLQEIDGTLTATAFDYVEHPKILSQPDADPDQLTREALEKFLSRNNLRGDIVCISVPGQSGLARFVKLPPVEEKKIADIVRFEAKQQIPFNLEEVVWDYQKIGAGTVTDGFAMDTEIGLFAMKRDMVNRYLQHFKDVAVEVHVVQMAPLALCNFVAYDLLGKGARKADEEASEGKKCVVALDIGSDSSNLVITDGEKVIWQRPIPLGGNHFTRALTKDMKLTFAKAEHLKRNALKSPELKKILTSIKPVLNDFVGEVQRSLGFFTNTHRDGEIEYLLGLGNAFRLPGLQKYLEEKLQLKVQRLNKLERLTGDSVVSAPAYTENILSYGVAYGLALQGMKQSRLSTNLLPGEIRTERLIRDKKPWAAAGAAALLLALGGVCLGSYYDTRAYGDPSVTVAINDAKSTVSDVNKANGDFEAAKKKSDEEKRGVESIVAGQAEQKHFLDLYKFIGDCVPQPYPPLPELPPEKPRENQPDYLAKKTTYDKALDKFLDGHHLPAITKENYWDRSTQPQSVEKAGYKRFTGKEAAKELLLRQLGKGLKEAGDPRKITVDELGDGIDDLIQFNIVGVNMRWTDDLDGYWKNLGGTDEVIIVRPEAQKTKPPSGKGWVVELQGYTWHNNQSNFVINALMENIVRVGMPNFKPDAAPDPKAPPTDPKVTRPGDPKASPPDPKAAPQPANADPVKDRISHVALYSSASESLNEPGPFKVIGQSVLDGLLAAPTVAEGAGPPAQPPGPPTGGPTAPGQSSRDLWKALGTGSFSAVGAVSPGPGERRPTVGRPPIRGTRGRGRDRERTEVQPTGPKLDHWRTEFIILFVWREDTPSDALRGMTGTAGPGGPGPSGPGPNPPRP
jgi:type IV pilus assembly protein PilM